MDPLAKNLAKWLSPPFTLNIGTDDDPTWFLPEDYLKPKQTTEYKFPTNPDVKTTAAQINSLNPDTGLKIFNKGTFNQGVVESVAKQFPFEKAVEIPQSSIGADQGGGSHMDRGGDVRNIVNNLPVYSVMQSQLEKSPVGQFLSPPNINIASDQIERVTVAHEVLHDVFANSPLSPSTPYKTRDWYEGKTKQENSTNFREHFMKTWESYEGAPPMEQVDETLRTAKGRNGELLYPYIFEPGNEDQLANERFAYYGSLYGLGGLRGMYPEFQKFYKGIIEQSADTLELRMEPLLGKATKALKWLPKLLRL